MAASSLSRVLPLSRVSPHRFPLLSPSIISSSLAGPRAFRRLPASSLSAAPHMSSPSQPARHDHPSSASTSYARDADRWRPMCLYHTQGKCTKMDDPIHLEKFNHNAARDLRVSAADLEHVCPQDLDHFLVLDLEGKVEILEFPVLIIDAKSLSVVDLFHRFVRPSQMSETRVNEYIEGKYGKFGVDRVWHDTAISFEEVIGEFETWLAQHHLWAKEQGGKLNRAAFVTCGNWDLKTKVPQQCKVSRIKLPGYFMEWINLKDVYLNFYHREARGMMAMMKQLDISVLGSHHLGMDDTKNIARVLQRMLVNGAVMRITAWRSPKSPDRIEFAYKNRI
ncbi:uncharacterized exonuclease domain-containing protein At3g15140 isoform X1 [Syzygium oleosum]|uniref:uncharacterized exonuclease domain-containing protein At3g15140 isoform X1 n=1 Tax=Syzygium oleosum TaxID=219896 RepID=UPI0011D1EAE9|nr:uncharacterized exonuclease domain-containing protein At3g15140 isoform X1 [Syzygium oleosum]